MSLEIIKEVNVDFHNTRYIQINAKLYDKSSRFILVTCYNQGTVFPIDNIYNYAYIRYRKSDDLNVFNCCNITEDGKILIELTEQMLAFDGKCYADLVIVHNEPISPDSIEINNGELIANENTSILSTMLFCINIIESALDNDDIESTNEYNALNELLIKATEDYTYVMKACKVSEENAKTSENNAKDSELKAKTSEENADTSEANAKESEEKALESEKKSKTSETNAKESEVNSKESETNAKESEVNSKTSENNAKDSELKAKDSEENAKTSETNAKTSEEKALESETNAKESEEKALESEMNAKTSEDNAKASEVNAKTSEENASVSEENASASANTATIKATEASQSASNAADSAKASADKATESSDSATLSKSYAIGGTNTRIDEDIDNSKYYYSQTKAINDSLGGTFSPQGTIEFSELQSVTKSAGYVYHISDDFVTDDTFKCGAGISYPSGTNVYYTSDGYWDCFVDNIKTLVVTDDGNGNVTIKYSSDSITTDEQYDALNQTIVELQERIKTLEGQNVLEIVE